jgi:hypothetical protein
MLAQELLDLLVHAVFVLIQWLGVWQLREKEIVVLVKHKRSNQYVFDLRRVTPRMTTTCGSA